jgi:hypothetical protein
MALMASRRRRRTAAASAGGPGGSLGQLAPPGPFRGPAPGLGGRRDAAQQTSEQIVGTVNATNVSSPCKAAYGQLPP